MRTLRRVYPFAAAEAHTSSVVVVGVPTKYRSPLFASTVGSTRIYESSCISSCVASGRLASLRSEIESGDRKPETREERMKRLFGDR